MSAQEATTTLRRVTLRHHGLVAAQAEQRGHLALEECVVADTTRGADPTPPMGVSVIDGSTLALRRCVVEAVGSGNAVHCYAGTETLEDTVVRDTLGRGLGVEMGCTASAARVTVSNARELGAGAFAGSTLTLSDSAIVDTLGGAAQGAGAGLFARSGAHVTATRTLIARSIGYGVVAGEADTEVSLTESAVLDTAPWREGIGNGVHVRDGARATVTRSLVSGSQLEGVWSVGRDARVTLGDVIVRDTRSDDFGAFGVGVSAAGGGSIGGERVAVETSRAAALVAGELDGVGGAVVLRGVFVRGVAAARREDGDTARVVSYGATVGAEATLDLADFVLDDAAWGFFQHAGTLHLNRGVVSGWRDGVGATSGMGVARVEGLRGVPEGAVRSNLRLPEVLLRPPPTPCALPPCEDM